MPTQLSNYDAMLKEDYEIPAQRAVNDKATVVIPQLTRKGFKYFGRRVIWAVHNHRSGATGGRGENEALPTARNEGYVGPQETTTYHYTTIKVTGQAEYLSQGNDAAFAEALDEAIQRGVKNQMNDIARQICGQAVAISGTNYTGAIGAISGVAANVLTFSGLTAGEFRAFFVGMIVDVMSHTVAGTKNVDGNVGGSSPNGEILSIDRVAKTITLRDATGAATSNFVVRQGAWNRELHGLRELFDPAAPHGGLDPATVAEWEPINATPDGAEAINEDLFARMHEYIETDGSGESGELFLASHKQFRAQARELQAQKRYDGREVTLKAGWKGLAIAEGTLARDKYMPDDVMYLISVEHMGWAIGLNFKWDERGGGTLYKALDDSDAVQARYMGYVQQIMKNRNSHAFADLIEPAA